MSYRLDPATSSNASPAVPNAHLGRRESVDDGDSASTLSGSETSSSGDEAFAEEDNNCDGWVEDEGAQATLELFGESILKNPQEALEAANKQGVDLKAIGAKLDLDALQMIRLINYIRKEKPDTSVIANLAGTETFLTDDAYLMPVIEDDRMLQVSFDEDFGNEDDIVSVSQTRNEFWKDSSIAKDGSSTTNKGFVNRIEALESALAFSRAEAAEMRRRWASAMGLEVDDIAAPSLADGTGGASSSGRQGDWIGEDKDRNEGKGKGRVDEPARDDDTHYFHSYEENEIHQTMIRDSVRTLSYGHFLLHPSNAHRLQGATVLDVGCGTGILSLFCARAGAKKVIAVDASDIVEKARRNVRENGWEGVVEVRRGKIEEVDLGLGEGEKVDIIVSEWMGYFLLYESMLDSVLWARDRYLRKGGLMAPSQCRMLLSAFESDEFVDDKLGFWEDVHGFKMNAMKDGVVDDAMTEVVEPETIISSTATIKDLPLQTIRTSQLSFVSQFALTATRETAKLHGFLSWFDTWFDPRGEPIPADAVCMVEPPVQDVLVGLGSANSEKNGVAASDAPQAQNGGEGQRISFTTGPRGKPTHWKQTVFLLPPSEWAELKKGDIVSGEVHVNKSENNSRELDVEIHWEIERAGGEGEGPKAGRKVQCYKVR